MSVTTNNNTTNTPSVGGGSVWGQAGCGAVGYSYGAIIDSMNALQQLVMLSCDQSLIQAKIGTALAQGNATAIEAGAEQSAEATREQGIASIVGGVSTIGCAAISFGQTYGLSSQADSLQNQNNLIENAQKIVTTPANTPEVGADNLDSGENETQERNIDDAITVRARQVDSQGQDTAQANSKPRAYDSWEQTQKDLYDNLVDNNPQAVKNAIFGSNALSQEQVSAVLKTINDPTQQANANTALENIKSNNTQQIRIIQDQISSKTQQWSTLGSSISSISSGLGQAISANATIAAGQQQALGALLSNAQQLNNNQLQTSQGYISKAYDQELSDLQLLATLAQAAMVG
jgi:hypothetical protein